MGCGSDEDLVAPLPNTINPFVVAGVSQVLLNQLLEFGVDGTAFRLDFERFTVARLDGNRVVWEVGGLDGGSGLFNFPVALATDNAGFVYVADRGNGEIDVLDSEGNLVREIGQAQLGTARDLALDASRNLLYVADGPAHQVLVFNTDGSFLRTIGQFGLERPQDLNFPSGVAIGLQGELHVVDMGNSQVQVYDASGNFLRFYGTPVVGPGFLNSPRAVVVDAQGFSYVADSTAGVIVVFDFNGVEIARLTPTLPDGTPASPLYLSLDPSGQLVVNGQPAFVA